MTWQPVSEAPALAQGEVHIWRRLLDEPAGSARAYLSADEQVRADRFSVEEARRLFVQRRAFLRRILSLYTKRPPEALAFSYGPMGKPEIRGRGACPV